MKPKNQKRKEAFLMHVYAGALARDIENGTMESQLIASYASQVPEGNIPTCPENAAKVFLSHVCGRGKLWLWMEPRPYVGVKRRAKQRRRNIIEVDFTEQRKAKVC